LEDAKEQFELKGASVELKNLNDSLPEGIGPFDDASILIVHQAAEKCFDVDPSKIRKELIECRVKYVYF
jgi:hypothetical protein